MSRYSIALGKKPSKIREKVVKAITPKKKKKRRSLSRRARQSILSDLLQSPEGHTRLAQSMAMPLRRRMDYEGVARRAFSVQPIPEGALPIYEGINETRPEKKKRYLDSVVVGKGAPEQRPIRHGRGELRLPTGVQDRRVLFLFELSSNPTIPLTEIRERRYDLIGRAQALARAEIQSVIDTQILEKNMAGRISVDSTGVHHVRPDPDMEIMFPGGVIGRE